MHPQIKGLQHTSSMVAWVQFAVDIYISSIRNWYIYSTTDGGEKQFSLKLSWMATYNAVSYWVSWLSAALLCGNYGHTYILDFLYDCQVITPLSCHWKRFHLMLYVGNRLTKNVITSLNSGTLKFWTTIAQKDKFIMVDTKWLLGILAAHFA